MMQDSARRIARVSVEAKLKLEEDTYVASFRPNLMDVVHAWSSVRDETSLEKIYKTLSGCSEALGGM